MRTPAGAWVLGAALAAVLAGGLTLSALAAKDDLDLVSRATGGAPADSDSFDPALSADGRRAVFISEANNLVVDENEAFQNVFVRDLVTGRTTLASRATDGTAADADSFQPAISGDGTLVAFRSAANSLVLDENEGVDNIFVHDLVTGTTTLVSRATAGTAADGDSSQPAISAGGGHVAFLSQAGNLSADENDAFDHVFVRDLAAGTTTLASRAANGTPADAGSSPPGISTDGRQVVFVSGADNLSTEDENAVDNVFVRDLVAASTTLASRAGGPTGPGADGSSSDPAISAEGRQVVFRSVAGNLSADESDAFNHVFVRDLVASTTTLASRAAGAAGAPADAGATSPGISADGRQVAFSSSADNLSIEDDDTVDDVFVRDLAAGTTTLASRASGPAGAAANATSTQTALAADGRHVAFTSGADNLSTEDENAVSNVFRRDVGFPSPPSVAPPPPVTPGAAPLSRTTRCAGQRATIVGTVRRDVIRGTRRRDVIAALAGNDLVRGLGGSDLICLGAGADRALGGPGADRILGGPGRDVLLGGAGRDRLIGQAGRDRALGGAGRDICPAESRVAC